MNSAITHLKEIFKAALDQVDPYQLVRQKLSLDGSFLVITKDNQEVTYNLEKFNHIHVVGAGKATARMALAVEEVLGNRLTDGLISVKYGFTEQLRSIQVVEAGHPIPDQAGMVAAQRIHQLANAADKTHLFIGLFSGGASALLPFPASFKEHTNALAASLEEKRGLTDQLIKSGASIQEINCVRKHISMIKGGRLAETIAPATSVNLILSDVIGNQLDIIASGPTAPDPSTFQMARAILREYHLDKAIPKSVERVLEAGINGQIPETPDEENNLFGKVENIIIGDNELCLNGALRKARTLGYQSSIVLAGLTGEAKTAGKTIFKSVRAAVSDQHKTNSPLCFIYGGETTVTVTGDGMGGRNQELALGFLTVLEKESAMREVYLLSASTDGNDGPTDAAGAIVCEEIIQNSKRKGLLSNDYLANNDSYTFFKKTNGLLKTGPSNTNVCDIQVVIVRPQIGINQF